MLQKTPARQRALAERRHFTEANVFTIKPKDRDKLQAQIWDAGTGAVRGLSILISRTTGTRSYRVTYYFGGSPKPHSRHIARVGEITLDEARRVALSDRGKARKGEDPRASDPTKSDAFKAVVERYIKHEQIGRRGNSSALKTQKVILGACEEWHPLPVATIRYQQIDRLLMSIRDGDDEQPGRPYMSLRIHAHLADFFAWCVQKRLVSVTPMTGMKKPWNGAKPRYREWFTQPDAVKAIWDSATQIGGDEGKYVKLMLLTGKRRGHLAAMDWAHIGPDWYWNPPWSTSSKSATGSKNKRFHAVPLPGLAQRVLYPRKDAGLVFVMKDSFTDLADKVRKLSGPSDFLFHGVRHLFESQAAELRDERDRALIPPYLRDMLLDHAPKRGAGAGYDHSSYVGEMRAALEIWADYVTQLVEPRSVTILR